MLAKKLKAPLAIIDKSREEANVAEVMNVIDALEDSDDVQNIYSNYDVSPEVQAELDED